MIQKLSRDIKMKEEICIVMMRNRFIEMVDTFSHEYQLHFKKISFIPNDKSLPICKRDLAKVVIYFDAEDGVLEKLQNGNHLLEEEKMVLIENEAVIVSKRKFSEC